MTFSMFAIVETGGKQYKVRPGQTVEVELLPYAPGSAVELDRVLLISTDGETLIGQPLIDGASIGATVARQGRGKKIIVFKYKSKKRYRRKTGHRQNYTYLTIDTISVNGQILAGEVHEAEPAVDEDDSEEANLATDAEDIEEEDSPDVADAEEEDSPDVADAEEDNGEEDTEE
jgi:large subunit ribosomal protein L21